MKIIDWLHTFGVHSISGDEYCLTCPSCFKPKLYFNARKRVGFCHYDKCLLHHKAVTTRVLSRYNSTQVTDFDLPAETPQDRLESKISFPPEVRPLVSMKDGALLTETPIACEAVAHRGVSPSLQYRYNLGFDGVRVYIPVYLNGEMVSYVGRAAWWFNNSEPRYKYPTHTKISNHLFDWDNIKESITLILVENSFNAINYNNNLDLPYYGVSTNFGSHLSDEQIRQIISSKVELVCLLWDGGSEHGAAKACSKLRDNGIDSIYGVLPDKTQPDDYADHEVKDMILDLVVNGAEGFVRYAF